MVVNSTLVGIVSLVNGSFKMFQYCVLNKPPIISTNKGLVENKVDAIDTGPSANAASISIIAMGAVTNSTRINK